ncbi:Flp family type IVb pilin [uncultured Alsobacter sp.]|uniref:Flp family type IVb pilin n=1 Tax=uncultured Alsobacter sp. TaxID=1748258 RepID=UPI0025CD4667|nr:Flp family type IVb pilin [uncultured Alsobacter sp.]
MATLLFRFATDKTAISKVEYGFVAATIALGLIGALATLKTTLPASTTSVPVTARPAH